MSTAITYLILTKIDKEQVGSILLKAIVLFCSLTIDILLAKIAIMVAF